MDIYIYRERERKQEREREREIQSVCVRLCMIVTVFVLKTKKWMSQREGDMRTVREYAQKGERVWVRERERERERDGRKGHLIF